MEKGLETLGGRLREERVEWSSLDLHEHEVLRCAMGNGQAHATRSSDDSSSPRNRSRETNAYDQRHSATILPTNYTGTRPRPQTFPRTSQSQSWAAWFALGAARRVHVPLLADVSDTDQCRPTNEELSMKAVIISWLSKEGHEMQQKEFS